MSDYYRDWANANCDPDDAPSVVCLPTAEHVAAKRHFCDACGGWIEPGERYRVNKFTVDGEFQTQRGHVRRCTQGD